MAARLGETTPTGTETWVSSLPGFSAPALNGVVSVGTDEGNVIEYPSNPGSAPTPPKCVALWSSMINSSTLSRCCNANTVTSSAVCAPVTNASRVSGGTGASAQGRCPRAHRNMSSAKVASGMPCSGPTTNLRAADSAPKPLDSPTKMDLHRGDASPQASLAPQGPLVSSSPRASLKCATARVKCVTVGRLPRASNPEPNRDTGPRARPGSSPQGCPGAPLHPLGVVGHFQAVSRDTGHGSDAGSPPNKAWAPFNKEVVAAAVVAMASSNPKEFTQMTPWVTP